MSLEAAVDVDRRRMDPGVASMAAVDARPNPGDVPGPPGRQPTLDPVSVLRAGLRIDTVRGAGYALVEHDEG